MQCSSNVHREGLQSAIHSISPNHSRNGYCCSTRPRGKFPCVGKLFQYDRMDSLEPFENVAPMHPNDRTVSSVARSSLELETNSQVAKVVLESSSNQIKCTCDNLLIMLFYSNTPLHTRLQSTQLFERVFLFAHELNFKELETSFPCRKLRWKVVLI